MQFVTCRVSLLKRLKLLLVLVFLVVSVPSTIQAQATFVRISVLSLDPAKIRVELNTLGSTEWSFRNTYTSVVGLADRIENFHGKDSLGREVPEENSRPASFASPKKSRA